MQLVARNRVASCRADVARLTTLSNNIILLRDFVAKSRSSLYSLKQRKFVARGVVIPSSFALQLAINVTICCATNCTILLHVLPLLKKTNLLSPNVTERIIIHASSETKEYWVPREHVTLGVQDTDTIGYLIDQLCYIFHRSRKMASHKESYPCKSRSMSLMLYNPYSKAEYKNTQSTLKAYRITNGTTLYLYYS